MIGVLNAGGVATGAATGLTGDVTGVGLTGAVGLTNGAMLLAGGAASGADSGAVGAGTRVNGEMLLAAPGL